MRRLDRRAEEIEQLIQECESTLPVAKRPCLQDEPVFCPVPKLSDLCFQAIRNADIGMQIELRRKQHEIESLRNELKSIKFCAERFTGNDAKIHFYTGFTSWACEAYQIYLAETGKPDVSVHRAGLFIDLANGWLAASPDRLVSDPLSEDSQGLCEIKCPYSTRNLTPENACRIVPNFCCRLDADGSAILRKGHSYYYQIQGQMAITGRNWCDFVVYTPYGISVERITFNESFWLNEMLPKLDLFYDGHYLPFYMEFFNP